MMSETALYLQADTSPFMMSIVIKTAEGNAVIIDGGRPEDFPSLREIIGESHVKAWIFTHPHFDHISGFTEMTATGDHVIEADKFYYNFPPLDFVRQYEAHEAWSLQEFSAIEDKIMDKRVILHESDSFTVDELTFSVLQSWDPKRPLVPKCPEDQNSVINESSLIFRIQGPNKSVLILGDAGPLAGDRLYAKHWQDLKSDIVQMAHHGHECVAEEIYLATRPEACLWCCQEWLYNEEPHTMPDRLYGVAMTRQWMDWMGVKTHYVTKDGTQTVLL